MKLSRFATSLICVLFVADPSPAQQKPVRLIAEAEDFGVKSEGWQVVPYRENYFASTFAISFLSRMGCLGAPEQTPAGKPAIAEQLVTIPYADEYQLLARYEQPYNFACEFTVEIEQGGKIAGKYVCGRLSDPKIWALNGHKRLPMERYGWGGTDNVVWQNPGSVQLKAGPATIRLVAAEQKDGDKLRVNAARRNVDVICLTNDKAGIEAQKKTNYLEFDGWLVQDGDLFVRFTNPKDGAAPCIPMIAPDVGGQHSPYYVHVRDWPTTRVLKSGRLTDATDYLLTGPRSSSVKPELLAPPLDPEKYSKPDPKKKAAGPPTYSIPDEDYLKPGESSGWAPLGQVLDSLNNVTWHPQAQYKGKADGIYLRCEFAIPDGKGGLRTIKDITIKGKPGSRDTTFEIPGNIAPNAAMEKALTERFWLPVIRTQNEAVEWLTKEIAKFPDKGPIPKRFLIYGIMGFGGGVADEPSKALALALGDNTATAAGLKRQLVAHWPDPKIDAIKKMEAGHKGGLQDVLIVSYGDEIHLPSLPVTDDEFKAWLKERGITYDGEIRHINPGPKMPLAEAMKHPLWYYSQICAKEKGAKLFAEGTAYYKSKGVLTGANYSPHANYLVTELDYIRTFKLKAMSMPWSEDYVWQIPEFSVQATGFLTSGLRAGAKYDNLPIHMYVMPHSPGNTPRDFRLSFYSAVAHGAKMINYFCASPMAVAATENYAATDDLAMWRQIHACTHEAGKFEDYVVDGKVRPAKVGLLLSSADDVITGVNNFSFAMHHNERKAIWYALRHCHVAVDFISEDDVIEGLAKDYRVIYVTQQYLQRKALSALKKWVEAGGTLVSMCGGGFMDEFQRPNPEALALYGVKSQRVVVDPNLVSKYLLKENQPFLTKQDLPLYEPIDFVIDGRDKVPVIVWKQEIAVSDAIVNYVFTDKHPAKMTVTRGKGGVILYGFLPGQAYLKSGLPIRPPDRGSTNAAFAHFLPTEMDSMSRAFIFSPIIGAVDLNDGQPVATSDRLVEATCIDTPAKDGKPARIAVPLMNFTGKPISKLDVTIRDVKPGAKVKSVERGELKPTFVDGVMIVELPIDVADMLLIDR